MHENPRAVTQMVQANKQFPVNRFHIYNSTCPFLYAYLSSLPSKGLAGSGSLLRVLQPFKPLTDTPDIEACKMTNCQAYNNFKHQMSVLYFSKSSMGTPHLIAFDMPIFSSLP